MEAEKTHCSREVTMKLLDELEALHARVERLEGFFDSVRNAAAKAAKAVKDGVHSASNALQGGKPNKELTMKDVMDALHTADPNVRHESGDDFSITVAGVAYTVQWHPGDVPVAFNITGGAINGVGVPTVQALKEWLKTLKTAPVAAPADLHRYAAAVLRQQMGPPRVRQ